MAPSATAPHLLPTPATFYFLDIGLAADPKLALTSGRVLVSRPDHPAPVTLVDHEVTPDGIDVCKTTRRIYWTCMGTTEEADGAIRSCALDGSDVQTLVGGGAIHTPKQLIVLDDDPQQPPRLLFCDREGMKLWQCAIDGSELTALYVAGDFDDAAQRDDKRNWCVGVAMAPRQGKVYWTQKGPSKGMQGRIMRADLAAGARAVSSVECVYDGLPEPIDLEIDEDGGWLYWTDRGELPLGNTLIRIPLATLEAHARSDVPPNRRLRALAGYEILGRNLHEAIGLKLDLKNRHVYSTDLGGAVYRFDIDHDVGEAKKGLNKIYDRQGEAAFTGIAIWYND